MSKEMRDSIETVATVSYGFHISNVGHFPNELLYVSQGKLKHTKQEGPEPFLPSTSLSNRRPYSNRFSLLLTI